MVHLSHIILISGVATLSFASDDLRYKFEFDHFHMKVTSENVLEKYRIAAEHAIPARMYSIDSHSDTSSQGKSHGKVQNFARAQLKKPVFQTSKAVKDDDSFSCSRLPAEFDPYTVCSGVVDYDFITTGNDTLATLETMNGIAREYAMNALSFINTACLTDFKRYICAQVYLPCVPDVVPGDTSTYQEVPIYPGGSTVALPYQRPCGSICTSVSAAGSTCMGILEGLGFPLNCGNVYPNMALDDNNIATFDFTSTPHSIATNTTTGGVCNNLESTIGVSLVAEPVEPYIGSTCTGSITQVITNQAASTDPRLTPLLGPYVSQSIGEATVNAIQSLVPRFFYQDCLDAEILYMCGVNFWGATESLALQSIFGPVYLPSFPETQSCLNFAEKCSFRNGLPNLLDLAPDFAPNCSMIIPGGVALFPNETQVVAALDLGFGPVLLTADPLRIVEATNMTVLTDNFYTQCPWSYDFVDDVELTRINGSPIGLASECYMTCPSHISTPEDNDEYVRNTWIFAIFNSVCGLLCLFNMQLIPAKKRNLYMQVLQFTFVAQYILLLLVLIGTHVAYNGDLQPIHCSSKTSWHSLQSTHLTGAMGAILAIQGYFNTIMWYSVPVIVVLMSSDILCRIVFGIKNVAEVRKYYMPAICTLYALLFFLDVTFTAEHTEPVFPFRVPGYHFTIFEGPILNAEQKYRFWFFSLPLSTAIAYGGVALTSCTVAIVRISLAVTNSKESSTAIALKLWKSYSMLFALIPIVAILVLGPITFYFVYWPYTFEKEVVENIELWIFCIIGAFTSTEASDYSVCNDLTHNLGEDIGEKGGLYQNGFSMFMRSQWELYVGMCIVALMFLSINKEVKMFYRDAALQVIEITGVIYFLRMVITDEEWRVALVSRAKRQAKVSVISSMASSSASSTSSDMDDEVDDFGGDDEDNNFDIDELDKHQAMVNSPKPPPTDGRSVVFSLASVVDTYAVGTVKSLMQNKENEGRNEEV